MTGLVTLIIQQSSNKCVLLKKKHVYIAYEDLFDNTKTKANELELIQKPFCTNAKYPSKIFFFKKRVDNKTIV